MTYRQATATMNDSFSSPISIYIQCLPRSQKWREAIFIPVISCLLAILATYWLYMLAHQIVIHFGPVLYRHPPDHLNLIWMSKRAREIMESRNTKETHRSSSMTTATNVSSQSTSPLHGMQVYPVWITWINEWRAAERENAKLSLLPFDMQMSRLMLAKSERTREREKPSVTPYW